MLIGIPVVGQIVQNTATPLCYIAYAGGFATGNFIGILVAEKLSLGMVLIRVITPKELGGLVECLKQRRYGVTCMEGQGANGPVEIVFTIVPRRDIGAVVELVKKFNSQAFYTIEEVDFAERGVFPIRRAWHQFPFLGIVRPFRRG